MDIAGSLDRSKASSNRCVQLDQFLQEASKGKGRLLGVDGKKAQTCELINGGVLVQVQLRVCDVAVGHYLHIYLNPLARIGHLLIGLGLIGRLLFFLGNRPSFLVTRSSLSGRRV